MPLLCSGEVKVWPSNMISEVEFRAPTALKFVPVDRYAPPGATTPAVI
jgi:hypothetical protein